MIFVLFFKTRTPALQCSKPFAAPLHLINLFYFIYVSHSSLINNYSDIYFFLMITLCINNTEHFYYQLMHITLKNAELLKHSKLDKNAPTCFGLHRNHLQGAKVSAWLKITRLVDSICVKDVQGVVSAMAAYCDL